MASEPGAVRKARWGFYASAVVVALFCLRLLGAKWSTHFPPTFPDALNPGRTDTYYAVAQLTPFRPSFYWAPRPVLYPAFVWLMGRNSLAIVVGQTAVYCGATGLLCYSALRLLRTRVIAVATVALILLVSVQARFALWTTQVLSESLSISLGAVMVAAWWWVAAKPSPRRVSLAWAATVCVLLERDSHVLPVALVVVPMAVVAGWVSRSDPAVRKRLLAGAALTVVLSGYVYVAQRVSHRNQYAFDNNIGLRVLPNNELRAWFVAGGMPLDAALLERTGHSAFDDDRRFVNDPQLERFRRWIEGPGSRRMLESLVVRAPDWYRMLNRESSSILSTTYREYDGYAVGDRLPRRTPLQLGGPSTQRGLKVWLVLASVGVASAFVFSRSPRVAFFAAGGLVFALVEVYLSYVGDALEVARHLAGAQHRLAITFVLAVAVGLDALWIGRTSHEVVARGDSVAPSDVS
jgi:hypothetical protein